MQLTSSVKGHSSCSCVVVLVPPSSFDYLLCHDVSGCKEHLWDFRTASSWESVGMMAGLFTAVVMLWVRTGRRARCIWYLFRTMQLAMSLSRNTEYLGLIPSQHSYRSGGDEPLQLQTIRVLFFLSLNGRHYYSCISRRMPPLTSLAQTRS